MKKIVMILFSVLLLSGCSIHTVPKNDLNGLIDDVFKQNIKMYNFSTEGYKYYIPRGVILEEKHDYNQVLSYNNNKYYLYIDVISYYYKKDNSKKDNTVKFFMKDLSYRKKKGYIEIEEKQDCYYIDAYYNYARIEAKVKKEDLDDSVINICYILNSVGYHDKIIESMVGENKLKYSSENFSLFDEEKDTSSFLEYVKEYDTYYDKDGELPTEDQIKVDSLED